MMLKWNTIQLCTWSVILETKELTFKSRKMSLLWLIHFMHMEVASPAYSGAGRRMSTLDTQEEKLLNNRC